MMTTWVTSDLHLGHAKASEFRNIPNHDEFVLDRWADTIKRDRDLVYVLGDVAFSIEALWELRKMPGRKILIRGNHDTLPTQAYLAVFEQVEGLVYKRISKLPPAARGGVWLSHAPIHPVELRGRMNVHGHTHSANVPMEIENRVFEDTRYMNVCLEQTKYRPIDFYDLVRSRARTIHGE